MRHLFFCALLATAGTASAYTSDLNVAFGPYFGGGSSLENREVRSTSGYSVIIDRNYQVSPQWAIGPRIEMTNGFVSTRAKDGDEVELGTFDNRIMAAGFRLSRPVGTSGTFAQGMYVAGVAGKSYSKLQLDVSTDTSYEQNQYSGIRGNYYSAEVGAWIPLEGNFGVNFSVLSSLYEVDLRDAQGTFEGDRLVNGKLQLTEGVRNREEGGLAERTTLRSHAARVAISLGF